MKTLLEFYDDLYVNSPSPVLRPPYTGAIFSGIEDRHADLDDILPPTEVLKLDLEYMLNRSGRKPITPLLYDMMYGDRQPPTFGTETKEEVIAGYISDLCYNMYADKWRKIFNALQAEYNPIENYSMTEKVIKDETTTIFGKKIDDTDTTTYGKINDITNETEYGKKDDIEVTTDYGKITNTDDDVTYGHTTTKNGTQTDTETITPGITTSNAHDVYAYNDQSTASHESKDTETRTGRDDREVVTDFDSVSDTESGTDERDIRVTDSGQDVVTTSDELSGKDKVTAKSTDSGSDTLTKKYAESGDEVQARDYEFTRKGNIGVTTSQQMIESEWELRKHILYDEMMSDVDRVLVLSCY